MVRGKYQSEFERGFIVEAQTTVSVTKTAQPAVSIGIVTKLTSAFRSMEKTSVNRVGQQHTFDDYDV